RKRICKLPGPQTRKPCNLKSTKPPKNDSLSGLEVLHGRPITPSLEKRIREAWRRLGGPGCESCQTVWSRSRDSAAYQRPFDRVGVVVPPKIFSKEVAQKQATLLPRQDLPDCQKSFLTKFPGMAPG